MCSRRLSGFFLTVLCGFLSFELRFCSVLSPTASRREDASHSLIVRRSPQISRIADPHEKCFETICNRVTHYCDEVIRGCASCEDDCHPGRIEGDELTTQECLRKCDWYYYINSLKSSLSSASEITEMPVPPSDGVSVGLTDYQLFAIVLTVVTVCFTLIIVIIIGVSCCFFKKLEKRRARVCEETAGQSSIYKPHHLRQHTSADSKRRQNFGDTDIKLLASCYEDSLNNRTGQQESIQNDSLAPSSISLASASVAHNCCSKANVAQTHRQNVPLHQSLANSSTQQLIK